MDPIRVLLVDDEDELVYTIEERLSLRGYHVAAVTGGADAMNLLNDRTFDVAVVDLKMPGMSGLVLLQLMRRLHPGIPVILLTGHGSVEEAQEGLRQGAFEFLFKPVDLKDLIEAIGRAKDAGHHG